MLDPPAPHPHPSSHSLASPAFTRPHRVGHSWGTGALLDVRSQGADLPRACFSFHFRTGLILVLEPKRTSGVMESDSFILK